jgi:pimeloyl-ACP methyl ester carboxylesterase
MTTDGLLLLHAFPVDARMWERQRSTFSHRLRVAAPDMPGFGGAEPAGEVTTMRAMAERALRELERAGIGRAVVCGLSMGGYVAFELWRVAPELVAGLVLANTRAGPDTEEGAASRRALADRLLAEGSGFLVEDPPALLSESAGYGPAARLDTGSRRNRRPNARGDVEPRHVDPARGVGADGFTDPGGDPGGHRGRGAPLEPRGPGRVRPPPECSSGALRG